MVSHYSFIGGKDRLTRISEYLKEHGVFPRPIILEATPEGYEILDGNHRMTAFLYLYGFINLQKDDPEIPNMAVKQEQPVWIGKLMPVS